MDAAAGDVEQLLPVADQQRNPQCGAAGVEVHCPCDGLVVSEVQDVAEELEQLGLSSGTRRPTPMAATAVSLLPVHSGGDQRSRTPTVSDQ